MLTKNEAAEEEFFAVLEAPEMKEVVRQSVGLGGPMETLTEAFYWIAGRTRSAIRCLPGLEKFEAEGVRNVRNKLLEHPEKGDSGVLMTSFSYGGPREPVLKAARFSHQEQIWPDKGLIVNAVEFAENLRKSCEVAVKLM